MNQFSKVLLAIDNAHTVPPRELEILSLANKVKDKQSKKKSIISNLV